MSTRGIKFQHSVGEYILCFEPDPTKARVLYDAKILDTTVTRDKHGNRIAAYHVHFQGWNNSWDRMVAETYIIKDSEDNRVLMKKLAEITRKCKINKTRNRRINNILKEAFKGRPPIMNDSNTSDDEDYEDSDESDDETDNQEETDETDKEDDKKQKDLSNGSADVDSVDGGSDIDSNKSGKSDDKKNKQTVELEIPECLKEILEDDFIAVNKENLVIKLPAKPNIINILEGFVKTFGINLLCSSPEKVKVQTDGANIPFDKNIPLCKELVDGVRICFDYTLPLILLYNGERNQHKKIMATFKYKPDPEAKTTSLQSPLIKTPFSQNKHVKKSAPNTPCTGESSPKIPKLSPKIFKKEKIEFEVPPKPEEVTPRRMTRQSLHESARKSLSDSSSVVEEVEMEKKNEVTPSKRTRRRKCSETSNQPIVKIEPEDIVPKPTVSESIVLRRGDPPPPLLIPSVISNQTGGQDSLASSGESDPASGREKAVENVLSWELIPDDIAEDMAPMPSVIYGAHHLLRLFVKLPDLLLGMKMEDHKLKALVSLLEHFLEYMLERKEELFSTGSYIQKDA